jgi:hypothetical protein
MPAMVWRKRGRDQTGPRPRSASFRHCGERREDQPPWRTAMSGHTATYLLLRQLHGATTWCRLVAWRVLRVLGVTHSRFHFPSGVSCAFTSLRLEPARMNASMSRLLGSPGPLLQMSLSSLSARETIGSVGSNRTVDGPSNSPTRDSDAQTQPEARSCVTVRIGVLRVAAQIGQRRTR